MTRNTLRDSYGRRIDDFDCLKYRVAARTDVGSDRGFSVESSDGWPITGCVSLHDKREPARFVVPDVFVRMEK